VHKKLEHMALLEERQTGDLMQAIDEVRRLKEINEALSKQSTLMQAELERTSKDTRALTERQTHNEALINEVCV
jgi:hypothetical protein